MAEKSVKKARECDRCKSRGAVMQRYNLYLCRRCFREMASKIGFEKHE